MGNEISDKQKALEAEIAAEVTKLQALQNDFVAKVQMAKIERNSLLKSDIFSKTIWSHEPVRSQASLDQDVQLQLELNRLREEQSALFAKGRMLTHRNSDDHDVY